MTPGMPEQQHTKRKYFALRTRPWRAEGGVAGGHTWRVWSSAERERRELLCQALPVQQLVRDWQILAVWAFHPAPFIHGI